MKGKSGTEDLRNTPEDKKCRAPGNGRARVKGLSPCTRNQAPGGKTLHKTEYTRKAHFFVAKYRPFRG